MNKIKNSIVSGAAFAWGLLGAGATSAWAQDQPPAGEPPAAEEPAAPTSPLIAPSITGPLLIQLPPNKYDMGRLGDIYVDGICSGLGQWHNNVVPNVLPANSAIQADHTRGKVTDK